MSSTWWCLFVLFSLLCVACICELVGGIQNLNTSFVLQLHIKLISNLLKSMREIMDYVHGDGVIAS